MKIMKYFKFQIKNQRGGMYAYVAVYLILLVVAICLRIVGGDDGQTIRALSTLSDYIARICMLVLAPIPVLILAAEVIERKNHPHLRVYGLRWGMKATIISLGFSIVAPAIYWLWSTLLFRKGLQWHIENTFATLGSHWLGLLEYLILMFVLAAIAFFVGVYTGSVLLALVITLFYTLIVEFFGFEVFGRSFWQFRVTFVTNGAGPDWWHYALYWFLIGVGLCIAATQKCAGKKDK